MALVEEYMKEDTFVETKAVTKSVQLLQEHGIVLLLGKAGIGKSRTGYRVLQIYCSDIEKQNVYEMMKLETVSDWENLVSIDDNVVVFLDDLFGKTNCIYDQFKDLPNLDKIFSYVCKGKVKVIVTLRNTIKDQCKEIFEKHRLFKTEYVNLDSKDYEMTIEDKKQILQKYMAHARGLTHCPEKGFIDSNGTVILSRKEILRLQHSDPVIGFPEAVYMFANNDKYIQLGSKFFVRPTEQTVEDIEKLRKNGRQNRNSKILYTIMVYTAINGNYINPNEPNSLKEVSSLMQSIFGSHDVLTKCDMIDSVDALKGKYLVRQTNKESFHFQHQTMLESVLLSFGHIDVNQIIPILSMTFITEMVRPEKYIEKEGEVVLKIPDDSYDLLAQRINVLLFKNNNDFETIFFVHTLCASEILKNDNIQLLCSIINNYESVRKDSKSTAEIFEINILPEIFYLPTEILEHLANSKGNYRMFFCALQKISHILEIEKDIRYHIKFKKALILSVYSLCSHSNLDTVIEIIEVAKQNGIRISSNQIPYHTHTETRMQENTIFDIKCMQQGYSFGNIPVIDYFWSRIKEEKLDTNLILTYLYTGKRYKLPLDSLRWMFDTTASGEIDEKLLLGIAFQRILPKTIQYLVKKIPFISGEEYDCYFRNSISDWCDFEPHCLFLCLKEEEEENELLIFDYEKTLACRVNAIFPILMSKCDLKSVDMNLVIDILLKKKPHLVKCVLENIPEVSYENLTRIIVKAYHNGETDLVKWIVDNHLHSDFDIELAIKSICEDVPIFQEKADEQNRLYLIKQLINKYNNNIFEKILAIKRSSTSGKFELVKWLLENVNGIMYDSNKILTEACRYCNVAFVKWMFEMSYVTDFDFTSLIKEVYNKCVFSPVAIHRIRGIQERFDLTTFLWEKVNSKDDVRKIQLIIELACTKGSFKLFKWAFKKFDRKYFNIEKIFMMCCSGAQNQLVKMLTNDVDSRLLDMKRALFAACGENVGWIKLEEYGDRVEMVTFLLQNFPHKLFNLKGAFNFVFESEKYELALCLLQNCSDGTFDVKRIMIKCKKLTENPSIYQTEKFSRLVKFLIEKYDHENMDTKFVINKTYDKAYYDNIGKCTIENGDHGELDINKIINYSLSVGQVERVKAILSALKPNNIHLQGLMIKATKFMLLSNKGTDMIAFLWHNFDRKLFDMKAAMSSACKYNNVEVVKWMLSNISHDIIDIKSMTDFLCKSGNFDLVKTIICNKNPLYVYIKLVMIEACSSHGNFLFDGNRLEFVAFLWNQFEHELFDMKLAMNRALACRNFSIVKWFLQNIDNNFFDLNTVMKACCRYLKPDLVQLLLSLETDIKFDINSVITEVCKSKGNPTDIYAVDDCTDIFKTAYNQIEILNILWKRLEHDSFNMRDVFNEVCKVLNTESVHWILSKINVEMLDLNLALNSICCVKVRSTAEIYNQIDLVSFLLRHINHETLDIRHFVNTAIDNNNFHIAEYIVEYININLCDLNMLLSTACQHGNFAFVRWLLSKVNKFDFDLKRAMNETCGGSENTRRIYMNENDRLKLVILLLENFDHNIFDLKSAIKGACFRGRFHIAKWLIENTRNELFDLKEIFNEACRQINIDFVNWMLDNIHHTKLDVKTYMNKVCSMLYKSPNTIEGLTLQEINQMIW